MRSIIIMFATYTRIPMPHVTWDEMSTRRAICHLPLAGAVIGLIGALVIRLGEGLSIPGSACACLMMAVPVLVTGGIHLDGFTDTSDARASWADREEKLRILKDPHVGAFGIIRLALYLLLAYAGIRIFLQEEMTGRRVFAATMIPVFSRACCALVSQMLPKARTDGMLAGMTGQKRLRGNIIFSAVILIVCAALLFAEPLPALIFLVCECLFTWRFRHIALNEFGGITGDLAGWYLCVSELAGIWSFAISALIHP